jgi:hypothetical protein
MAAELGLGWARSWDQKRDREWFAVVLWPNFLEWGT